LKGLSAVLLPVAVISVVALSGCSSSFIAAVIPDVSTSATTVQTSVSGIQGNVYGGHAPLYGAHVYVLQASTAGYGAQATSLLNAPASTNNATVANTADYGIPTTWNYTLTGTDGSFSITGDYASCTAGLPVWLYAYGGSPTSSGNNVATFSSAVVSNYNSSSQTATYTFNTSNQNFFVGEQVTLSNVAGSSYAIADGTVLTVTSTNLTASTFSAVDSDPNDEYTGTVPASGTVTGNPSNNPGIVNMAMLGLCPSSGSFATGGTVTLSSGLQTPFSPLSFVYMNEVSTVATVYAMAGFGTDGSHIGVDTSANATTSSPGIQGLQNAALTAANLYSIAGTYNSTVYAGEGHIANPVTPAGNGAVPQAELDTLGNILAACVDSNNTYNPATGLGTVSPQCSILFTDASSTGGLSATYNPNNGQPNLNAPSGTPATNTAQAAFNIAHFPQSPYVTSLYTLPTGNVPFTPHLTTAPNDFTVGILYTSISGPTNLAIDSYGDVYVSASSGVGYIAKYSTQGSLLAVSPGVNSYLDSIAVDQAGNVWGTTLGTDFGGQNGNGVLYKFDSALSGATAEYSTLFAPTAIAIDNGNNLYVTQYNSFPGGGGNVAEFLSGLYTVPLEIPNSCATGATSVSVDTSGDLWLATNAANSYCRINKLGGTVFSANGNSQNYNVSLTSTGTGWFGNHSQTNVYNVSATGTATAYGKGTGTNQNDFVGGIYQPSWSAVDGAGNVFFINDNGNNSSVSKFSSTGTPLSCPNCLVQGNSLYGYQPGGPTSITGTKLNGDVITGGIAVDPSGNVWIPNYTGNSLLEIVGVGTPVVTPLSSLKYGTKP
jgi:hypothetical protein